MQCRANLFHTAIDPLAPTLELIVELKNEHKIPGVEKATQKMITPNSHFGGAEGPYERGADTS